MSKNLKRLDENTLDLPFGQKLTEYEDKWNGIRDAVTRTADVTKAGKENEIELSIEISAAIKRAIRETGMSREEVVDEINNYFGRSTAGEKIDPPECRAELSIHMLNHYLSKPVEYPIPAYYLVAITAITGSYEPVMALIHMFGAKVSTAEEQQMEALGKLEMTMVEMNKLKKQLKKGVR